MTKLAASGRQQRLQGVVLWSGSCQGTWPAWSTCLLYGPYIAIKPQGATAKKRGQNRSQL
jgi:hypothetical protein